MKKFLLALLLLCPSSYLYSGTIDPFIPDSKYVEYGSKFTYVLKLCGSYEDDTLFCASCVAIDKHHILTAAHVVKGCKQCYVVCNNNKIFIDNVIIHKDFETKFGVGDIAMGYSTKGFDIEYYPPLYEDSDEVGKVCSIAGYGLTGNFYTGAVSSDNKKRAGSNRVDNIDSDLLICTPTKKGHKDFTALEFLIGSGDSGGGLFIDGKLAGINSCVMAIRKSPMSKYGEESGHTRISKFIVWIKQHKIKHE